MEELRRDMRITSLDHNFENFKHLPGTDESYCAFLAMATREDCRPFLLCYGGVGNGKTYLCEALIIKLRERGIRTRLYNLSDIGGVLKRAMRPENGMLPLEDIFSNYCKTKRLIIDDVGMGGSDTEWTQSKLEELVNYRYRERLMTVITTNRDVTELPERVYSRFCDPEVGVVVLNKGEDFRRR